jgi:hypothetical protein
MFELVALLAVASLMFGVIADEELFRLVNTLANFATVALIVWHQQHVRRKLEPEVKDAAAIVKRQLGERHPSPDDDMSGDGMITTNGYSGPERRKRKVE